MRKQFISSRVKSLENKCEEIQQEIWIFFFLQNILSEKEWKGKKPQAYNKSNIHEYFKCGETVFIFQKKNLF